MEPSGGPNFELPAQPPPPEAGGQGAEQAVEKPPARQEQAGKQAPQAAPLPPIPPVLPASDQPVIAVPPDDISAAPTAFIQAHDNDHIETVWLDKAKDVIARTQDDPYLQKHEMSRVKAEYIQKRFGKQIKTDDRFDSAQGRPELSRGGEAAA